VSDGGHVWWEDAIVYEVYPRSFADADGDGVGDLPGLRSRLGYLADLGVDAIWLTPFYPSPLADGGYDVSDYCAVDPLLGTMADFDALVSGAAAHQIRVIIDLVPNHCSSAHPLFRAALAGDAAEDAATCIEALTPTLFATMSIHQPLAAWLAVRAAAPVRTGRTGPELIPVLRDTGLTMLVWSIAVATALTLTAWR